MFGYNHNVIYHGNCTENGYPDNSVGETSGRISERALEHTGKDIGSHLYRHSIKTDHQTLKFYEWWEISDYGIIENGYQTNSKTQKLADAISFLIKELKEKLNEQNKSMPLELFIWI